MQIKAPVMRIYCPHLASPWVKKPFFVFVVKSGTMQRILDKREAVK